MFKFSSQAAIAVALVVCSDIAVAQTTELPPPAEEQAALQPAQPATIILPALTVIELRVLDEVSSKTAVTGAPIRLALARPLYLMPELGLPAGTPVEGVVIHAAKGGMGGKSGELLLGAKSIELGPEFRIPLRSFKLGPASGKNNETLAFATAVAVGLPALLINGGSAWVPAGTQANAKTSVEVSIPATLLSKLPLVPATATPPALSAPAPATQPISTQGESK